MQFILRLRLWIAVLGTMAGVYKKEIDCLKKEVTSLSLYDPLWRMLEIGFMIIWHLKSLPSK